VHQYQIIPDYVKTQTIHSVAWGGCRITFLCGDPAARGVAFLGK
jgi:hypothetical protein